MFVCVCVHYRNPHAWMDFDQTWYTQWYGPPPGFYAIFGPVGHVQGREGVQYYVLSP